MEITEEKLRELLLKAHRLGEKQEDDFMRLIEGEVDWNQRREDTINQLIQTL